MRNSIVTDESCFSDTMAIIDADEYAETMQNMNIISYDANKFVQDYVNHCTGIQPLNRHEYQRRYEFSPLKYFHEQLGI